MIREENTSGVWMTCVKFPWHEGLTNAGTGSNFLAMSKFTWTLDDLREVPPMDITPPAPQTGAHWSQFPDLDAFEVATIRAAKPRLDRAVERVFGKTADALWADSLVGGGSEVECALDRMLNGEHLSINTALRKSKSRDEGLTATQASIVNAVDSHAVPSPDVIFLYGAMTPGAFATLSDRATYVDHGFSMLTLDPRLIQSPFMAQIMVGTDSPIIPLYPFSGHPAGFVESGAVALPRRAILKLREVRSLESGAAVARFTYERAMPCGAVSTTATEKAERGIPFCYEEGALCRIM